MGSRQKQPKSSSTYFESGKAVFCRCCHQPVEPGVGHELLGVVGGRRRGTRQNGGCRRGSQEEVLHWKGRFPRDVEFDLGEEVIEIWNGEMWTGKFHCRRSHLDHRS
jgi:hypothetical protein